MPKPINFRPQKIEDLILERLSTMDDLPVGKSKSDLVRFCIRIAGEHLLDDDEYKDILLYIAKGGF